MVDVVGLEDETSEDMCVDCEFDPNVRYIRISRILPNPHHRDTHEWIELENLSYQTVSLYGCQLDDRQDG